MEGSKRTVLITGCSTGIGHAVALHLARRGNVVFAAMRRAQLRPEAVELRARARDEGLVLHTIDLDVNDSRSREMAVGRCLHLADAYGGLDVLINNAGVGGAILPVEESPDADFVRIMQTNFHAPVALTKLLLPYFRERGRGSIINVTSIAAVFWSPNQASYCASKAALEAFTCALRQEVMRFGVQVSSLQPGVIVTPILVKDQVRAKRHSPYTAHVRLSKKFYTASMAEFATQPIVVAEVVEQMLQDADRGEQRPIYTAGEDAARMIAAIRRAWASEKVSGRRMSRIALSTRSLAGIRSEGA